MGKKGPQEKNIQVVVRCRPRNTQEVKDCSPSIVQCLPNKKELLIQHDIADKSTIMKTFGFDKVFGPDATQIDVYRSVVCPLLEEVLLGYNCTVFAYGQTGTGKTFTMQGEKSSEDCSWDKEPQAGIIPRAMQHLFERLEALPDCEFSVRVSFLEIYNEDLFDLLAPATLDSQKLRLFEDSVRKGSVFIQGLEEMIVRDKNDIYEILERGRAKRQTAATLLNAHSSRSHSLFSVTVHIKESSVTGEEMLKIGKLNLVDLAGSENVGKSGAVDKRLREAGTINQSLLTLGRVITSLVERAPHIPYRESKLTRLLQDSLGGRTKTSIIATISPAACNMEETLSTLDYAHRAKNILNRPEINQKLTKKALIKGYTEEIDKLKKDLIAAREKNGIYLALENYNELQNNLKSKAEVITEAQARVDHLEQELTKFTGLFNDTSEELAKITDHLHQSNEMLHNTKTKLKHTIEDRDGLEFLVENYSETEGRLYETATTLMGVVEISTCDNDRLFSKLEKMHAVETNNAHQKTVFKTQSSSIFSALEAKQEDFLSKQEQRSSELLQWIDDVISKKSDELYHQSTSFQEKLEKHQQTLKTITDTSRESTESCRDWKDDLSQKSTEQKAKVIEMLGMLTSDDAVESMRSVQETLDLTSNFLKNFGSYVTKEIIEQQMKRVADFQEYSKLVINELDTKINDHQSKQSKIIEERIEKEKKTADEYAKLQTEMSTIFNRFSELAHSNSAETVEELTEMRTSVQATADDSHSLLKSLTDSSVSFFTHSTSCSQNAITEVNNKVDKAVGKLDTAITLHPRVEETTRKVSDGLQQYAKEWDQLLVGSLNEHYSSSEKHSSLVEQTVKEATQQAVNTHQETETTLLSSKQSHKTFSTSWKENIDSQNADFFAWSNDFKGSVKQVHKDITHFIEKDLKEDIPTGTTPARRQYKYPVDLPKTEEAQKLLEIFKDNYEAPLSPEYEPAKDDVFVDEYNVSDVESDIRSLPERKTSTLGKENEFQGRKDFDVRAVVTTNVARIKNIDGEIPNARSPLQVARNTSNASGNIKESKLPRPTKLSSQD